MAEQPHFPVFVFGDGDAMAFLNQADVGVFLERDDVADGTYSGFDYDGQRLVFEIGEDGIVRCHKDSNQGQHDQLMEALREHLSGCEEYEPDSDDGLVKAIAVGMFVERHIEYPSFWGWLKSLLNGERN